MASMVHPRLGLLDPVGLGLMEGARQARILAAKYVRKGRAKRGSILQPGPDMPLWGELRRRAVAKLVRHGDQVLLARYLGLSKQRVHLMLRSDAASPDAERTLRLLAWVVSREQGRNLT